ncbi:MAG: hypothetical protein KIS94_13615 [Chitinophagales bacterium]|nr:hypothetical protein [Chitinophagales bacterium]
MARNIPDAQIILGTIPVVFLDKTKATATSEGNNAGWHCQCNQLLIGRCYYQFGWTCYTVCPTCGKAYRVDRNAKKQAIRVREVPTPVTKNSI